MTTATIYVLLDPRDAAVRYVGQTTNLERRSADHRSGRDPSTGQWVRDLHALGLNPVPYALTTCAQADRLDVELGLIRYFRNAGADLLNAPEPEPVSDLEAHVLSALHHGRSIREITNGLNRRVAHQALGLAYTQRDVRAAARRGGVDVRFRVYGTPSPAHPGDVATRLAHSGVRGTAGDPGLCA